MNFCYINTHTQLTPKKGALRVYYIIIIIPLVLGNCQ